MAKMTLQCLECEKDFQTFNSKQKFCCRLCYGREDSRRKKEKYKHKPHHNKGYKHTDEWKQAASIRVTDQWKDDEIRKARIRGMKETAIKNGYSNGWDLVSIKKRNKTIEENGGHNLKGKYGTRQCDITFEKKYGMTSAEYRMKRLRSTKKTKPESQFEDILKKLNIDYIYEFKFKNRYFDFAIEAKKILIEIDGTYWHGKGLLYEDMNDQQKNTFMNDRYKDTLVKNSDWKLIRIWSDEINESSVINIQ